MSEQSYMEKLLDGVEVEWKALGEVCAIKTGPNINKNVIANRPGFYPVINSGREPLGYVDHFNTENDPIGIASRGSVGLITWTPGRFFRGNLNYSCTVKEPSRLDVRFLYHFLLHADAEIGRANFFL
jgi:type I restriction enzyme S subunit